MLIEFLGVPGCGKSALSRHLAEILMEHRLAVDEPTYDIDHRCRKLHRQWLKLCHILTFAALNPRRALSESLTITGTRQASVADLRRAVFNWLFIRSVAAPRRAPRVITVLDQGLAQALWTAGFAARRSSWLELLRGRHTEGSAMPDLVVHVRADFAAIGDRLERRTHHASRMDSLGRDPDALQRAGDISNRVASRLRALGVAVIEVDNNDANQLRLGACRIAAEVMARLDRPHVAVGTPAPRCPSNEGALTSRLAPGEIPSPGQSAAPVPPTTPMSALGAAVRLGP